MTELTPAEERVLRLRAQGMTTAETAHVLGISEQTLKNHMTNIYGRLDVATFIEALIAMGWVHVPDEPLPPDLEWCRFVAKCGRRYGHRGQHGGFRSVAP